MTPKIARFLAEQNPPSPCLVVDLDVIAHNFKRLHKALPLAQIYYAVKANPAAEILRVLEGLGSNFDAASIYEIEQCMALGIGAQRLSFGSTIKKEPDIAAAFRHGVNLFAFDSPAELDKLARAAPGARVFCRIFMTGEGADWPLSRKFGCDVDMACDLLVRARDMGLDPHGVSFHVGSQQRDLKQWDVALGKTKMLFTALTEKGIELKLINLGGGFPAKYRTRVPTLDAYGEAIMKAMTEHFGNNLPQMIVEPGRGVAGDAGVIQAEVVLISTKSYDDKRRWVYLDIGKFGGLPETMGEAIQYRLKTPHDGGPKGPVVLAGPTCDEVDVLYDAAGYQLPLDLAVGDKIQIMAAGAYTTTYASVGFNGFPPLTSYYI
ncbi:MAG: type III PLP-dependent enzyme [Proteobacteria bacterium]|nr:type III PLP-dependent enzyme [Pseudomonadota bacterium]MBI3708677.1 type III PLP-dependent enzyme [Pseudomonadota bacterium]